MLLSEFLEIKHTLLLDGAMGTELQRHGVDTSLPLWSARAILDAPFVIRNIHFFYLHAGADILTTNTFRTNIRTLKRVGLEDQWEELNLKAVEFAFEARDRYREARPVLIAGSIAPLEDCYSPDLTPSHAELAEEHQQQAELLASSGIDFFLVETMPTIREAMHAAIACHMTGREFAVSFVCNTQGRLLSGEPLRDAVAAVLPLHPAALLVNCVSTKHIIYPLEEMLRISRVPVGCYANVGTPSSDGVSVSHDVSIEEFAQEALHWKEAGASIIGGCCGTTPEHMQVVRTTLFPPITEQA